MANEQTLEQQTWHELECAANGAGGIAVAMVSLPIEKVKALVTGRTRPAAPVDELETVFTQFRMTDSPKRPWGNGPIPEHLEGYAVSRELVTRSQAEAVIAAKDAEIAELKEDRKQADLALVDKYRNPKYGHFVFPDDVAAIIRKLDASEAENAALTARVKELSEDRDSWQRVSERLERDSSRRTAEKEALENKLATTRKALEFYGDVHKYPAPLTGGMGDLWRDCGEIARNALAETFMPTHTHLKRGSSYSYFGTGTFQTDSWVYPHRCVDMGEDEGDMLSCDMQQVAVYLEDDGKIWVRPVGEFNDGRFKKV